MNQSKFVPHVLPHVPAFYAPRSPFAASSPLPFPANSPVPTSVQTQAAVSAPISAAFLPPASPVRLNDAGRLIQDVTPAQVAAWKQELWSGKAVAVRRSSLHLWLGQHEMAAEQHPQLAFERFALAQKEAGSDKRLRGQAAYAAAEALFYEGAYQDAADAFHRLLVPPTWLPGYDHSACALFYRHAAACAGYHAQRAAAGIPEPPRLDPFCGVAALAAGLKSLGRPSGRRALLAACRVTGRGSTLKDLVDAGPRLGVTVHAVSADDKALMSLPKPLVAYVEHDHFVALTRADRKGVSYLCSDCGAWPGGRVNLTWKQWHLLEPGIYGVVTLTGGSWDQTLSALLPKGWTHPIRVASALPVAGLLSRPASLGLALGSAMSLGGAMTRLRGHVFQFIPTMYVSCGSGNYADHCAYYICCPKAGHGPDSPGGNGSGGGPGGSLAPRSAGLMSGASSQDPVNLATGEEEYTPDPDLEVYNPHGPGVVWQRIYNSLRTYAEYLSGTTQIYSYSYSDFGLGWSNPYKTYLVGGQSGTTETLVEPNDAQIPITLPTNMYHQVMQPTASNPIEACSVPPGVPLLVTWNYSSSGNYFVITHADRSRWTFATSTNYLSLSQITDRNRNSINFNYANQGAPAPSLTTITDASTGTALLTLTYTGSGNLSAVSDCYGRSVYYSLASFQVSQYDQRTQTELTHVSQIVPTGTANPPDRYAFNYHISTSNPENYPSPFLTTITVPSPAGPAPATASLTAGETGTSTATINYNFTTCFVTSLVDANGNTRTFTQGTGNTTVVTDTDHLNNTVYSYTAGFTSSMSDVSQTDGAGHALHTNTYSDPNDPYRPSSTVDGNGKTWAYTWDSYGHLLTKTPPFDVHRTPAVTTYTYSYSNFALAELTKVQEGTNLSQPKTPTTYTYYEPSGLLKSVTRPQPGTAGSGSTVVTSYTYDNLGNILTIIIPGNNSTTTMTTTMNYTSDPGNSTYGIAAYSQPASIGQPLTITDNLGNSIHQRYDAQGNVTVQTDAIGNEEDFAFNIANQPCQGSFPKTGQTGNGHTTSIISYLYPGGPKTMIAVYDESNNLARQESYAYGAEGEVLSQTGGIGTHQPTSLTYDALYRPATVADGAGHTTSFTYNTQGYLAKINYPGGDSVQLTSYDANGNLLQRVDGRGITTNYIYNDPESLLTDIQYPATPTINVHYGYDSYGRGQSMTDGSGSTTVGFDDLDNKLSVAVAYTGVSAQTITYGYYSDGTRKSMATPGGSFSYGYDSAGRCNSLTNPFNETTTWSYLNNGWLSGRNVNNVFTEADTRNALGELTDLAYRNSSNTIFADFGNVQYDAVGNAKSVTSTLTSAPNYSGTTQYVENSLNQLTSEQSTRAGGYTNSFQYDSAGNPTTFRSQTGNTFNQNNQITNAGFVYDGNGNPTIYKGTGLTFDAENRLTQYGNILTANYTGSGQRAWKQSSAGRTYFLYDGMEIVNELSVNGTTATVTAVNTFANGHIVSRHTTSGSVFYVTDLNQNVSQRLDGNGNVLSSQMFDSYGQRQSTDSNTDPFAGFGGALGCYTDYETGLELMTYRFYDPSLGRFVNRDPAGYAGGANLYEYVGNNPLVNADPLGLAESPGGGDGDGGTLTGVKSGLVACITNLAGSEANPDASVCKSASSCFIAILSGLFRMFKPVEGAWGFVLDFATGVASCIADIICDHLKCSHPVDGWCMLQKCTVAGLNAVIVGIIGSVCNRLGPWLRSRCEQTIEGIFGAIDGTGASFPITWQPDCEASIPPVDKPFYPTGQRARLRERSFSCCLC